MISVKVGRIHGTASLIICIDTLLAPGALFEGNERTILRISNVETARNENSSPKKVSEFVGGIKEIPFSFARDFTVSVARAPTVVKSSLNSFASIALHILYKRVE
jgi:hypothetical protein